MFWTKQTCKSIDERLDDNIKIILETWLDKEEEKTSLQKQNAINNIFIYINLLDKSKFLKLIDILLSAEKNKWALYTLARIYAGKIIDGQLYPDLQLPKELRQKRAIEFACKAISLHNDAARRFLITALMSGTCGCISANGISVEQLLQTLSTCNHKNAQASQFEYGCYLLGFFPNGNKISSESNFSTIIPVDYPKSLEYFRYALYGVNKKIINKSFDMISLWHDLCTHNTNLSPLNTINFFIDLLSKKNHQLLSLYLAYIFCPENVQQKIHMHIESLLLPVPTTLSKLAISIAPSIDKAISYSNNAAIGSNDLSNIALYFKKILEEEAFAIYKI